VYASPYVVLASFASLAYLTLVTVLALPSSSSSLPFRDPKPVPARRTARTAQQQKQTVFLHLYGLTWALLLLGTLGITRVHPGIGGGYLLSAWNACVWAACVLCLVEGLVARSGRREGEEAVAAEHADDERTPLIQDRRRGGSDHNNGDDDDEREGEGLASAWWLAQFAVSVPVPVALFAQVAALLLDAVPQTLADGGAPALGASILLPCRNSGALKLSFLCCF
jgi:hypothetical protein